MRKQNIFLVSHEEFKTEKMSKRITYQHHGQTNERTAADFPFFLNRDEMNGTLIMEVSRLGSRRMSYIGTFISLKVHYTILLTEWGFLK